MSRFCIALTFAWVTAISLPAFAGPPLIRDFAACAGRYSAALERDWLLNLPTADRDADRRAAFVDLIEALLPSVQAEGLSGREVLHWRIEAKFAQARLFQTADFGTDPDARGPAATLAAEYLSGCDAMLLSG